MRRLATILLIVVSACATSGQFGSAYAQSDFFEKPPVDYFDAEVDDVVTRLTAKLKTGETRLEFTEDHGYLASLLKAFDVPVSSQTLVFSKTSLQSSKISPQTPRAIYFNDDVFVGWCRNGEFIEIAAHDATQGPTFYTLDQVKQTTPIFDRDRGQCISCHAASRTQDVPGYLTRSVYTTATGLPDFGRGTFDTNVTSPLSERWGGWYATGTHGKMRHMGNTVYPRDTKGYDFESGANLATLDGVVSTDAYQSSHSDIVALMVLDHQTQMLNALTFANYETRMALHQSQEMNKILQRDPDYLSDTSQRRISNAAQRVVEHLLMCDEFKLTDSISGTSGFTREFSARGPRDSKDRSLREFDLQTRLFRYPCSYMIYSAAFDRLPDLVRKQVIEKLLQVLSNEDRSEKFQHLSDQDRKAILEILAETKPGFGSHKSR
jgi:hypothetical protein